MAQAMEPEAIAALIDEHRRVGEALREMMSGLAGGAGVDRSIFAPGAKIVRGYSGNTTTMPSAAEQTPTRSETAARERQQPAPAAPPTYRRDDFVVHPALDGFTLEEALFRDLPDGTTIRAGVCLVCTVEGGQITHVEEYADNSQFQAVTSP
jgi:ketosteroid isomerase-like protein